MQTETTAATSASSRPFTGKEFLESLRGPREVWIYGERVKDVTAHPAFRNPARMLARLYDALHDPAQQPVLTCPRAHPADGPGQRAHRRAHRLRRAVHGRIRPRRLESAGSNQPGRREPVPQKASGAMTRIVAACG